MICEAATLQNAHLNFVFKKQPDEAGSPNYGFQGNRHAPHRSCKIHCRLFQGPHFAYFSPLPYVFANVSTRSESTLGAGPTREVVRDNTRTE